MNVIRVYGGIGNQMFQYAFGRAQQSNGIDVYYDISWMEERELRKQAYPRPARLNKFQAKYRISRLMHAPKVREHFAFTSMGKIGFDLKLLKMDGYNFDGYWQYLAYFEHLLPELKQELKLKPEVYTHEFLQLRDKIRNSNSVSVHVRRGDYLTHKGNFKDLVIDYYYDAIKLN